MTECQFRSVCASMKLPKLRSQRKFVSATEASR